MKIKITEVMVGWKVLLNILVINLLLISQPFVLRAEENTNMRHGSKKEATDPVNEKKDNVQLKKDSQKEKQIQTNIEVEKVEIPVVIDPIKEGEKVRVIKNESREYEVFLNILPLILIVILFLNQVLLYVKLNRTQQIIDNNNLKIQDNYSDLMNKLSIRLSESTSDLNAEIKQIKGDFKNLKMDHEDKSNHDNYKIADLQINTEKEQELPEITKPVVYQYFRSFDSNDSTDSNDKRSFYRIWEQGGQLFFEINSEINSHLFLLQASDSYLKGFFDFKNSEGSRIKNITPGKLEIQPDGKFKVTKNGEIEII